MEKFSDTCSFCDVSYEVYTEDDNVMFCPFCGEECYSDTTEFPLDEEMDFEE